MAVCVWSDALGYRCPDCKLFVCVPHRDQPVYCPRCP